MPAAVHEEWKPLQDFAGYSISDHGRIRNDRRQTIKVLTPSKRWRYPTVSLRGRTINVHRLVAFTFLGPPQPDQQVRHLDGDPTNNHVFNLAWGTASENNLDRVKHGTHQESRKTHCPAGHCYDADNTFITSAGRRQCRVCDRARKAARRQERSVG